LTNTVFADLEYVKSDAYVRGDRPYQGMNITGVTGLTTTQKDTLKKLGAIELN